MVCGRGLLTVGAAGVCGARGGAEDGAGEVTTVEIGGVGGEETGRLELGGGAEGGAGLGAGAGLGGKR